MTGRRLPVPVYGVSARVLMQTNCGPYAYIAADFEPPGRDGLTEVLNAVPAALLPEFYVPCVRAGIVRGLDGVAASVLLTDARFHDVDSSEYGYRLAGLEAGRAALVASGLLPPEEADSLRWADWPGRPRPWPGHNPRSEALIRSAPAWSPEFLPLSDGGGPAVLTPPARGRKGRRRNPGGRA
ncbi:MULTISPECIES: hypothetical protein [unclassified Streptomyces]|uniref:hypothetical protein n=1 Tax=unclassified Streptomyces TaxID=2593676 RepID=UPI000DC77C5A|nr:MULTISPECIES: hypothetical protein [unclassified Streptomyces]AWZ08052.1 hypothetical protein DRB89_29500 [Streptomyces sp. ICC4]AWZ15790.1 hypothetical protein DRB96_30015 [Streptomyces sp. ICC1]